MLAGALAEGWGFETRTAEYAPVGAGSYHWIVTDRTGERRFVSVDDLDTKPWLGDSRDSGFVGLGRAFDTAARLREHGLEFVVAPLRTLRGSSLVRIDARYAVCLLPFVDGQPGDFDQYQPGDVPAILAMLARLHAATSVVATIAPRMSLNVPGRERLESAMGELGRPWTSGPFAEPARKALDRHATDVADLVAIVGSLAARLEHPDCPWVVTHGEPHAGNMIRTDAGHVLIDWDTVALAPRERDLWMVIEHAGPDVLGPAGAIEIDVDWDAVRYFRIRWLLTDIVYFTDQLRSPHDDTEDTDFALEMLAKSLASIRHEISR